MGILWSSGRVSFQSLNVLDLRAQSKQCRERPKGFANVSGSRCPSVNVTVSPLLTLKVFFFVLSTILCKGRGTWVQKHTRGC